MTELLLEIGGVNPCIQSPRLKLCLSRCGVTLFLCLTLPGSPEALPSLQLHPAASEPAWSKYGPYLCLRRQIHLVEPEDGRLRPLGLAWNRWKFVVSALAVHHVDVSI
jgi:hypothetical protein